jgi:hypothetical protein
MSDPRADFIEAAKGVKKLSEFHRSSHIKILNAVESSPQPRQRGLGGH